MHLHAACPLFFLLLLSISTTFAEKSPTRSKKSKARISVFGCTKESIDGRSAFFCYRRINGRRVRQGILVQDNNNYYCGQFEETIPKGKGFFFLGNSTDPKVYCGDVVNGQAEGYGANHYLSNKQFMIGRFSVIFSRTNQFADHLSLSLFQTGFNDGPSIVYIPSKHLSARVQYKQGVCQSAIWYNDKGARIKSNQKSCGLPKNF